MTIAKIMSLLPVPDDIVEEKNHDWGSVFSELGTKLPKDYIEFLSVYGSGVIGDFLWILNPHSLNRNLNLEKMRYFREAYQVLRQDHPAYYPREFQEFLPWGFTDNGDSIVWINNGMEPNEWLVGIQAADPSQEELTGLTMLDFLEALLENRLVSSILPRQFLDSEKEFRPL